MSANKKALIAELHRQLIYLLVLNLLHQNLTFDVSVLTILTISSLYWFGYRQVLKLSPENHDLDNRLHKVTSYPKYLDRV